MSELLVAGLRARDPRAAREAWSTLSPLVSHQIRRTFDAGADREDLAQEVFLRFFARIDELRNPGALRSFLYGICSGVAQNERRRAHVRRAVELAPADDLAEAPAAAADLEARELAARLQALLDRARPADRRLFLLRYAQEMELAELAAAYRVSLSTLRRRLARATRRIQVRLRAEPALEPLAARLTVSGL
jgi:RNA polymerase sigma-70 factor (ECF subfamily)